MGDRLTPPRWPEALVAPLIPPACREEVLGDLHECNATWGRYVLGALRTVPLVIGSRVRRTSDVNQLLMCAAVLYFSFFAAAWFSTQQLIYEAGGPWRVAIPCAAALLAMVLHDAYSGSPGSLFARLIPRPFNRDHSGFRFTNRTMGRGFRPCPAFGRRAARSCFWIGNDSHHSFFVPASIPIAPRPSMNRKSKIATALLAVLVCGALSIWVFVKLRAGSSPSVSYSQFMQQVQTGKVLEVRISAGSLALKPRACG